MYLNTLDVQLTPRTDTKTYNIQINESVLNILSLIFEFKLATSWQISRLLIHKDQNTYIYLKLRRMWQAHLLESFKTYSGSLAGIPVYYMLSKKGLQILQEQGKYNTNQIRNYPKAKTLLAWGLFKHEAQVVELASMEAKNNSEHLSITFKGEDSSQKRELLSDKNVEAFTPDYFVCYTYDQATHFVYSEFERTNKSKEAMLKKIERYYSYLSYEQRKQITLRIIFQTQAMEASFWLNLLLNKPGLLQNLNILTTNLMLIEDYQSFIKPLYATSNTIRLNKEARLKVDIPQRAKLFSFL